MKQFNLGTKAWIFTALFIMSVPMQSLAADKQVQAEWKQKMQSLYQSLAELLTDVCSDERYFNSKNSARIEREIKSISNFSHEIDKNSKDTNQADPTLHLFSKLLADETNEAFRSFRAGNKDYARDILRSIPGNCLACHSRNSMGPDFASLPLEPNAPLLPAEKASFYAATRQFDRAIEGFQKVIKGDEKSKIDSFDIEKSVADALTIAVRFKRDPKLAKSIVQLAIDSPASPHYYKEEASQWLNTIDSWSKEPVLKATTEEGLFAESQRLISLARSNQTYPMDHSGDIYYLRASSALYDLIQLAPHGKHVNEALLLLGMCYEVLSPRRMENLHNKYYEACILGAPHTETARTCYHRYEKSIYFGFTGSSGTHLPPQIKQKLLDLWSKAMPTKGNM